MPKKPPADFELEGPLDLVADLVDGAIFDGPKEVADDATEIATAKPAKKAPAVAVDPAEDDEPEHHSAEDTISLKDIFRAQRDRKRAAAAPPAKEKGKATGEPE